MGLIRRPCPSLMVLDAGVLLADGPPGEVLARSDVIAAIGSRRKNPWQVGSNKHIGSIIAQLGCSPELIAAY